MIKLTFLAMEGNSPLQRAEDGKQSQTRIWIVVAAFLLLQGCVGTVVGTAIGVVTAVAVGVVTLPFKAGAAVVKAVVPDGDKKKDGEKKAKTDKHEKD